MMMMRAGLMTRMEGAAEWMGWLAGRWVRLVTTAPS